MVWVVFTNRKVQEKQMKNMQAEPAGDTRSLATSDYTCISFCKQKELARSIAVSLSKNGQNHFLKKEELRSVKDSLLRESG